MSDPIRKISEEGDEARNKYLEKALHANEEAASGAKMTDLFNKDSIVYKDPGAPHKPTNSQANQLPPEKPTVDAEGFPIVDPVHTYREDLANIVNADKLSLSRIAMMQGIANQNTKVFEAPKKPKLNMFVVGSIVLLVLSVVVVVVATLIAGYQRAPVKVDAPKERYIILSEDRLLLETDKITKSEVTAAIKASLQEFKEEDSIKEIIPISSASGAPERISLQTLLDKISAKLPEELKRNYYSGFFLGLHSEKGATYPFLITFVDSYDIAYAGMLEWEGTMRDDMSWLFDTRPRVATTTLALNFKDRIILSNDVRSFEDATGRTAFFYTFLDSHTVLFAKSAGTVREVTDRLRQAKFQ